MSFHVRPRCLLSEVVKKFREGGFTPASRADVEGQVEVVSDLRELMKAGILMPPAVKINDRVVVSGRVPKVPEVVKWLGEVAPKQV